MRGHHLLPVSTSACRLVTVRTVALYSPDDRALPHTRLTATGKSVWQAQRRAAMFTPIWVVAAGLMPESELEFVWLPIPMVPAGSHCDRDFHDQRMLALGGLKLRGGSATVHRPSHLCSARATCVHQYLHNIDFHVLNDEKNTIKSTIFEP